MELLEVPAGTGAVVAELLVRVLTLPERG